MNDILVRATRSSGGSAEERGLNTAELLGNAALAIVALIAIWAALKQAGLDIIEWITDQLFTASLDA